MENRSVFARTAGLVDEFFAQKFYSVGSFVGRRPCVSILLSLVVMLIGAAGFSQLQAESRADKLWVPQGTRAQEDEAAMGTCGG